MLHDALVTTVVITRNGGADLLGSLARHRDPVIVIDNGSTDGTPDQVESRYPDIQLVRLPANLGAPARNLGVYLARTPYVAFADDDSWWAPGALDRAEVILRRHPDIAAVAARILVGEQEVTDPICRTMAESPLPNRPDVPGRCVAGFLCFATVVRRDAFLDTGGFDDVVFFDGEEERVVLDLLTRGWELVYAPDVVAHHHPPAGRHGSERAHLKSRNRLLTAVMRRPWPIAARHIGTASLSHSGRRGLAAALPRLPKALLARRRVPAHVEVRLASAERPSATTTQRNAASSASSPIAASSGS